MKTAMILAAGRGERLKPLTDTLPKAMCVVKGKPLIEHHVLALAKAGFERLVINHAYLGGAIRHHLGDGRQYGIEIIYSPEPPGALETGGAIVNALPLLGNTPFVTVNADVYTDFDFTTISLDSEFIHLILVKNNSALKHHGDFGLTQENLVTNTHREYTFPGIACYHPQVFSQSKIGRYSVTSLIRQYVDIKKVTGSLYTGKWFDIGTYERLHAANES